MKLRAADGGVASAGWSHWSPRVNMRTDGSDVNVTPLIARFSGVERRHVDIQGQGSARAGCARARGDAQLMVPGLEIHLRQPSHACCPDALELARRQAHVDCRGPAVPRAGAIVDTEQREVDTLLESAIPFSERERSSEHLYDQPHTAFCTLPLNGTACTLIGRPARGKGLARSKLRSRERRRPGVPEPKPPSR